MSHATAEQPPERTHEQRMAALQKANSIRTARARLKRTLVTATSKERSRMEARRALLSPPSELQTMKVWELLLSVRGFGKVKVNRILVREHVSPTKTVGGLSSRQRHALATAVTQREWVVG